MSPKNQLTFRRRRWWIVPVMVAVGLAGAFLSLQFIQPEYKATCGLFVANADSTPAGDAYAASQVGQQRVAAYIGLIKVDRVADGAIRSLGLNDLSPGDLAKRIEAKADAESVFMNVSVTDSQSQRSAALANAVCAEFQAFAADAEGPSSSVVVKLVEKANAPQHPVSPNVKRLLAVGALIGLLSGVGLVRALERIWPEREPEAEVFRPHSDAVAYGPTVSSDNGSRT
jgi:polysaccharide biosynthesis transport protein